MGKNWIQSEHTRTYGNGPKKVNKGVKKEEMAEAPKKGGAKPKWVDYVKKNIKRPDIAKLPQKTRFKALSKEYHKTYGSAPDTNFMEELYG